jgi:hypothetical protein
MRLLPAIVVGVLASTVLADEGLGKKSVVLEDPAGDVYVEEANPNPADIVRVEISSDGTFVTLSATLTKAPTPGDEWPQGTILVAGFDTDLDETNGSNYFAESPVGMEYSASLLAAIQPEGAASESSAVTVIDFARSGEDAYVVKAKDAFWTAAKGLTYTGRIPYASIGATSGQTVRISVKEAHDYGEGNGFFPPVLLTLK